MAQQEKDSRQFGNNGAAQIKCIDMQKRGPHWTAANQTMPEDDPCGIEFLRDQMDGVEPEDVEKQGVRWVATSYLLLSGCIPLVYSDEVFEDPSNLLGRYALEMGKVLEKNGIEFKLLKGITDEGIKRLDEIDPL